MEEVHRVLEVERIINLVRGFGWDKKAEEIEGDKVTLTIEKTIQSPVPPESGA